MAKCNQCGKRGLFLRVDSQGRCANCADVFRSSPRPTAATDVSPVVKIPPVTVPTLVHFPFPPVRQGASFYPLRQPHAVALRVIRDTDGFADFSTFDADELKRTYFAMSQAGKSTDPAKDYQLNYVCRNLFKDIPATIRRLFDDDYFVRENLEDAIKRCTVSDLGDFAASHGLVRKGTKATLVERILTSIDPAEVSAFVEPRRVFVLGHHGAVMVRTLYNDYYAHATTANNMLREAKGSIANARLYVSLCGAASSYWHSYLCSLPGTASHEVSLSPSDIEASLSALLDNITPEVSP